MKIVIIGKGDGWFLAPYAVDGEIWGVSDVCMRRDVDLAFNMHNLDKHKKHKLFNKTIGYVNKHQIPIVTQKKYEHIPTSIEFPLDFFRYHRRYFTNSIDYMVAYAWYKNSKRSHQDAPLPIFTIEMYGVVMAVGTEYAVQRPSLEYWIGTFEAEGAEVIIHEPTHVCKSLKGLYGYDWDEEDLPHILAREENK